MIKMSMPSPNEYSFQSKEYVLLDSQPFSIEDILTASNEWDNVTLSGIGAKQLKLAEATFADSTGAILVDL